MNAGKPVRYRFGRFEADVSRSSLVENGTRVPLQEKPFLFLATLLQSEGHVVTRDELSRRLWPDTHVQVDQGLNAAARKVRKALGDDAANPKYVETLGSRGYRFICPLQPLPPETAVRTAPVSQSNAMSLHELYLRGRHFWNRRTPPGLGKSLYYFNEVLKVDPEHALAHAGVADAYNLLATHGLMVPKTGYAHAKIAAKRALELDADLAEAHVAHAWASLSLDYAWPEARRGFEQAIELNPEYAFAYNGYSYALITSGEVAAGLAAMQRARELEPVSLVTNALLSNSFYYAREYEKSVALGESTLELDFQFPIAHAALGLAYVAVGRKLDALKRFEDAVRFSEHAPIMVAHLAYGLAEAGHTERARETVDELSCLGDGQVAPAFHIAVAHLAMGDRDEAFRWMKRAQDERFHWVLYLQLDPRLDAVRDEPEYADLCNEIRFPSPPRA